MTKALAIWKWLAEHRLAVLGFAVAAAYWPTFLQGAFTPRWIVLAIGLPLLCSLDPRNVPVGIRWVLLWLLALAAISTTFASPDRLTGYFELIFMAILCVAFLAGAGMASLDNTMMGLGAGLAISSVLVLIGLNSNDNRGSGDISGLFFNTEVLAEFAALVFVWSAAKGRMVTAAAAVIPILFCGSRVAIVVAMAGLLYAYRPRSKWLTASMVLGLIIAAVAMVVMFKISSADHRLTLWMATIFAWTQYGHGLGWFLTHYPLEQFAHSDAIQMLAELGIGALAVITIPIYAFRNHGGDRAARATFIAVCIEVFVSFPLHLPATGFVAAIVAGHLVGAGYRLRLGERERRIEDGASVQRGAAGGYALAGTDRRVRGSVSPGPIPAHGAALRAREDRNHSAAAGAV